MRDTFKMSTLAKLRVYVTLMRLDKPIGIYLLLWPTLWGIWVAGDGQPPLKILFIFILGVILMRSVGCIVNDLADKDFDGFVKRTAMRPLVTQAVSLQEAWGLVLILSGVAFALV